MKCLHLLQWLCILLLGLAACNILSEAALTKKAENTDWSEDDLMNIIEALRAENEKDVTKRQTTDADYSYMDLLCRQVELLQDQMEERVRSDGDSGLKQIRHNDEGTRPYYSQDHAGQSVAAIHDHDNYIRTIGSGELNAVLNGVEFRTRHNDYRLIMPHTESQDYHAVEDIPFPEVPLEVSDLDTIEEQVAEMKEFFKAWKDQNSTHRNYKPHFKPVLCYLEGAWTHTEETIDEPFESARHWIDASSWFDLQEKIRFTSYTGSKSKLENLAHLPTAMRCNNSVPFLAQWNYRIVCHPLKNDLPLNRFRVIDDPSSRMRNKYTLDQLKQSRMARFQLNPYDTDEWVDGPKIYGLLDELMAEVPGYDNYVGDLTDEVQGLYSQDFVTGEPLNTAYYSRWSHAAEADAMGLQRRKRGFADENVFMAMTSQPKVAGESMQVCEGRGRNEVCTTVEQKWTYAIPLEIIYLTPLSKWNPYNLEYKGDYDSDYGKTVTEGGRTGQTSENRAFDGINSRYYYMTPAEFFTSNTAGGSDPADTTRGAVGVLDKNGVMKETKSSGTHIFLPEIDGIGSLRQRYPIMPIHGQGSGVWKALEALMDVVLSPSDYQFMMRENTEAPATAPAPVGADTTLCTGPSSVDTDQHVHTFTLSSVDAEDLNNGNQVTKQTSTAFGHTHTLLIKRFRDGQYRIMQCDNETAGERCWDKHPRLLEICTP